MPIPKETVKDAKVSAKQNSFFHPAEASVGLFNKEKLPQEAIVASVLKEYQSNNVLIRSILSGPSPKNSSGFNEDIWFDLDQLQRQRRLDHKKFREVEPYHALAKKLLLVKGIIAREQRKYMLASGQALEYVEQIRKSENPQRMIEELKKQLDEDSISALEKHIIQFAIARYPYEQSSQYIKDILKNRNYSPPHETVFYSYLEEKIASLNVNGNAWSDILREHGINYDLYAEIIGKLGTLKESPKTKEVNFSSKEQAEQSLREYINYRSVKNELHRELQFFFPEHRRKNAVSVEPIETDYQYFTGYQIIFSDKSIQKIEIPQVPTEGAVFNRRNRNEKREDKVIATPASWSYAFPDLQIGLFSGRKGTVVFGLVGLEKELAILYSGYDDMASTHSIVPGSRLRHGIEKDDLLQKKRKQREKAVGGEQSADPWYEPDTGNSGHTESVLYGAPAGIIVQQGWEDIAWEARQKYAAAGLIHENAPFFTYDPKTGLKHIPDCYVLEKAAQISIAEGKEITGERSTPGPGG